MHLCHVPVVIIILRGKASVTLKFCFCFVLRQSLRQPRLASSWIKWPWTSDPPASACGALGLWPAQYAGLRACQTSAVQTEPHSQLKSFLFFSLFSCHLKNLTLMQQCGFPHFFVERALWLLHRMWIQRCSSEKNKQHWLRTWNQIQALFLLQMTGGWCFFLLPWSFFTHEISNNFALING